MRNRLSPYAKWIKELYKYFGLISLHCGFILSTIGSTLETAIQYQPPAATEKGAAGGESGDGEGWGPAPHTQHT